jgi:heme/copper-type cytochrome/quinol oxidase subunit 2
MADRSWFFAANGQQQGPYPEAQFRDLIARGSVNPQTLVWSEGMAGWQKAGEVPGLMGGAMAPPGGGAVMGAGGYGANPASYAGSGALSLDLGIWDFTWRSFLLLLGLIFVIPAPWAIAWYLRWAVPCVKVPGRPNLSFEGSAGTMAKWYFGTIAAIIVLAIISAVSGSQAINTAGNFLQIALYWLLLKYLFSSLASNSQPLGLSFSGSFWAFLGWNILLVLAVFTIIGWAWVYPAQMRWICRNIQGTRRAVVFKGTGLQYLWRFIVVALASVFIIPIPWMFRWMLGWQLSQIELVDRGASAREVRVFE